MNARHRPNGDIVVSGQLPANGIDHLRRRASAHRQDAFAACEFVMDYLKTRAPFWKREATPEGGRWVAARASDTQAALRWRDDVAE